MRHKQAIRRIIAPDPKYGSVVLAKFTNYLMEGGKKNTAQRIVYGAFEHIQEEAKRDPLEVFAAAIKNVAPAMEVKSKRVGGANYQVPVPVRGERRQALAFRWLIEAARSRKGKPMVKKLTEELLAASNNEGVAVKKRMDVARMAEANRAFAHFAW
ncbi:30S ribosomal protein S7 [Candidatus Uhrbacteria bacterium]|nr:30S ribosomal protein S7 [Candidatus Uhrbacteria bacterium]